MSDNDKRILSDEEWNSALLALASDYETAASAFALLSAHEAARREREAADAALLRAVLGEAVAEDGGRRVLSHDTIAALRARIGGG